MALTLPLHVRRVASTCLVGFLAVALFAGVASAQPAGAPAARAAVAHLEARLGAARASGALGLAVTGVSRSSRSGYTYVYVRPAVDGVEVADDPAVVVVDAAGTVVYERGDVAGGEVEAGTAALGPADAATRAASGLSVSGLVAGVRRGGRSGEVPLSASGLGQGSSARLVYHRTNAGRLRLAYEVALYPADPAAWVIVRIDAATGAELWRHGLAIFEPVPSPSAPEVGPPGPRRPLGTAAAGRRSTTDGASYRVYPAPLTSPADAALPLPADGRTDVVGPADPTASPFGWHDTDGQAGPEFTTTRGNNADAFPDRDASGFPDPEGAPDGGPGLIFASPVDFAADPAAYADAATTNAFYWANLAHDVLYHYGFDEEAGNFQVNQYGHGGLGGDPVRVRVQNGGITNNAYMSVPADGSSPAMLLLEWTYGAPRRSAALDNTVVVHEYVHGLTNRLTGGGGNVSCLGSREEQMGEGWSDWYALMLTMRRDDTRATGRGIGAYAFGQGAGDRGLRPAYYSTDRSLNDYTYGRTQGMTSSHSVGFVWATILWEVTWDLIDAHGFSAEHADAGGRAGNQVALSLVTEALRLQPCQPGFVSGRDAVLAADVLLYGGTHLALLRAAFARRGLGASAAEGSTATNADNVEAFDLPTPDATPPAPVADLTVAGTTFSTATLTFTATGDDGAVGTARFYDVRYALQPIVSEADFRVALRAPAPPPGAAGTRETLTLSGLRPETTYHVALRVLDDWPNASALSNSVLAVTPGVPPPPPPPVPLPVVAGVDSVVVSVPSGQMAAASVDVLNTSLSPLLLNAKFEDFTFSTVSERTVGSEPAYPSVRSTGTTIAAWVPTDPQRAAEDEGYADIALPFAFPFDGEAFSSARVFTNGFLTFSAWSARVGATPAIPSSATPNALVAPYWTDLRVVGEGRVYAGALSDGQFAIEYDRVVVVGREDAGPVSFQIVLSASGEIGLAYERTIPYYLAVVRGVESRDGGSGIVFPPSAPDGVTYRLISFQNAVTFSNPSLSIPASSSATIRFTIDAAQLPAGRHTGTLRLSSASVTSRFVTVPVVLYVGAPTSEPPSEPPPPEGPPPAEPIRPLPVSVQLSPARPNPTRGGTAFTFGLPADMPVRLAVYDVRGREVAVLADGAREAGWYDASWAPADAVGLYVVRLIAGAEVRTTTVVVVR